MQLKGQRGQTLPFWVIGVLITLSLAFFLANYVNMVAWQIRAQNAADSAASGALSVQTNVLNEYSTILYATAVDEYRIRVLNQAILMTIYPKGACSGVNCDASYQSMVAEYNTAVNSYTEDIHLLQQANNMTQGGQSADQARALSSLGTGCATTNDYACAFRITAIDASNNTTGSSGGNFGYIGPGDNQVDLVACKNVSYFGGALLKLNSTTYPVMARSAAAVVPVSTTGFTPGTAVNPATGQAYQPVEHWAAYADGTFDVNFAGLTVNLNWYQAGPIKPYSGTLTPASYTCS